MDRTEFAEWGETHWPALYEMGWHGLRGWVNYITKNPDDFHLEEVSVAHIEKLAAQATTIERKDRNTVADEVSQWFGVIAQILELHAMGVTPEEIRDRLAAPDGGVISMDTICKQIKDEQTRVDRFIKGGTKDMDTASDADAN